ncbi:LysR family transcriptional regulator [Paralcaligenes ginsengisoli]
MQLLWELERTGSVTRAADRVAMSQPAASALIRQIEERLGFPVFVREKKRLTFTVKGRALLPDIANALAALDSLNRLAVTMRTDGTPRVVIGSVASVAATILPSGVERLCRALPGAAVTIRTAMSMEIKNMVAEQRVDFGVVVAKTTADGPGHISVAPLHLCCLVKPEHPFSQLKSISIGQIATQRYVALARPFKIGEATANQIESAGFRFAPAVEVMQFSTACAFVKQGWGVGVLDSLSAQYASNFGLVTTLVEGAIDLEISLLWSPDSSLGSYANEFASGLSSAVDMTGAPSP